MQFQTGRYKQKNGINLSKLKCTLENAEKISFIKLILLPDSTKVTRHSLKEQRHCIWNAYTYNSAKITWRKPNYSHLPFSVNSMEEKSQIKLRTYIMCCMNINVVHCDHVLDLVLADDDFDCILSYFYCFKNLIGLHR